uniref:Uncharacterized protein n=1 Tax=Lygus hesperus TaxID=30085 RepID=A0A146L306_LYGHE
MCRFQSDLSAYLPLIILGLSGLLGSFFMTFLPGRVCRDLHDLPEETEYGHENVTQQRLKNPRAKLLQPKWSPPPRQAENIVREQSVMREPSTDMGRMKQEKRTVP